MNHTSNNRCVILDNTQLNHVTLRPCGHLQSGNGDLVRVFVEAKHHGVDSVWGEVRDGVRVHLVIHLKIISLLKFSSNIIKLENIFCLVIFPVL